MCIIAAIPKGLMLKESVFDQCWTINPHGGGLAYVNEDNQIRVHKTLDRDAFKETYYRLAQDYKDDSPFLVHFRITTHGGTNIYNTHPFRVHDNVVMMHNGIIHVDIPKGLEAYSDTRFFTEFYLNELPADFLKKRVYRDFIAKFVGSHNKLAFLTNEKKIYLVNEDAGNKSADGIWFSNYTWRGSDKRVSGFQGWSRDAEKKPDAISQSPTQGSQEPEKGTPAWFDTLTDEEWKKAHQDLDTPCDDGCESDERQPYMNMCDRCQYLFGNTIVLNWVHQTDELLCDECYGEYMIPNINHDIELDEVTDSNDESAILLTAEEVKEVMAEVVPLTLMQRLEKRIQEIKT